MTPPCDKRRGEVEGSDTDGSSGRSLISNEDRAAQERHGDDAHVGDRLDQLVNASSPRFFAFSHVWPLDVSVSALAPSHAKDGRLESDATRGLVPDWYQTGT